MAMWFTGLLERHGSQEIQISDAEFNRSFDLTISTENDGVRFTSGWGKFVKEANLQSGEILIFMKTDCPQKLRYTVAMSYKDTQVCRKSFQKLKLHGLSFIALNPLCLIKLIHFTLCHRHLLQQTQWAINK